MTDIEPYKFRERTNLQEHNDIVSKLNEVVDVINETDMDNLNMRLTNDESQIAVNTSGIKANKDAIAVVDSKIDSEIAKVDKRLDGHDDQIYNLHETDTKLENAIPQTYTLYRDGTGKIKAQVETIDGSLMDSNTLDMIIPYQYDIVSGTTNRSFKLNITMSDGSSYTTNDFVIPEGGGTDITVTGITLSKDSTNVNRFHVGINLSDGSMIDSGFITIVDSVSGTFSDNKLVITVNGVSSVPIGIDTTGTVYDAGNGITIADGTISIDSTVVALKTDIADMETKTNASATYATKTALALTDSVANDANEKANSAIDNVSISGSTMTFTKINDEHIDIEVPTTSLEVIDCIKIYDVGTITYESSTGKVTFANFKDSNDATTCLTMINNVCCLLPVPVYEDRTSDGVTCYKITPTTAQYNQFASMVKDELKLTDGYYMLNIGYGGVNEYGYFQFGSTQRHNFWMNIIDNEITTIGHGFANIYAHIGNPANFQSVGLVIWGIIKVKSKSV